MEVGSRTPLHSAVPRGSPRQDWLCLQLQVPSSLPDSASKGTSEDGGCSGRCHIWIWGKEVLHAFTMRTSGPWEEIPWTTMLLRPWLGRDADVHPCVFLKHRFDSSPATPPTCLASFNSKELIPKSIHTHPVCPHAQRIEEQLLCGQTASHATNMRDTRVQAVPSEVSPGTFNVGSGTFHVGCSPHAPRAGRSFQHVLGW